MGLIKVRSLGGFSKQESMENIINAVSQLVSAAFGDIFFIVRSGDEVKIL